MEIPPGMLQALWARLTQTTFLGMELWRPIALFVAILLGLILGKTGRFVLNRWRERWADGKRPILAATAGAGARSVTFLAFALALVQGIRFMGLSGGVNEVFTGIADVLFTLSVGWVFFCSVDVAGAWLAGLASRSANRMDDMLMPLVRKSLKCTIAVLTFVQIAQVLSDKPITSILAGLGVGGLAVALAAQDTIKNFFGSLVIFMDKPFALGDRVVVDGHDGPVEEVGMRSTKIRTLEGHLVTIPNGELANKTLLNIGKRPYIRRLFNVSITYNTPPDKVVRAKQIIEELLHDHEGMNPELPPRVYFDRFADCSLNLIVIYWYHPPDYWAFLAFGERINLELLRRFNDEGIEFAFPTRTLYLTGEAPLPLRLERSEPAPE
jgi:MscS family membrane protein